MNLTWGQILKLYRNNIENVFTLIASPPKVVIFKEGPLILIDKRANDT